MQVREPLKDVVSRGTICGLSSILHFSHVKVDFWGSRKVVADGYDGDVDLVDIARRLIDFSKNCSNFALYERQAGVRSINKAVRLYQESDVMQNSNLIKRIFAFFQKLLGIKGESFCPYSTRWHLEDYETSYRFQRYSQEQFRRNFPTSSLPTRVEERGDNTLYVVPIQV